MPTLRDEVAFERRLAESSRIREKYPHRIPLICERASRSDLPEIDKKKFLVPMNMMIGEFKYLIHKSINEAALQQGVPNLTTEKTIYLFVNNSVPKAADLLHEIYEHHVSEDGFLYMEYSAENTLGRSSRDSYR